MSIDQEQTQMIAFLRPHPGHRSFQVGGRRAAAGERLWNERRLWNELVAEQLASDAAEAQDQLTMLVDRGVLQIEIDTFDRSDDVGRSQLTAQRIVYVARAGSLDGE